MANLAALASHRLKLFLELLPAGRDLHLVLAGKRLEPFAFRGLFESNASARAAASRSRPSDYDIVNQEKAKNKQRELESIEGALSFLDYPLLYWLSKTLTERSAVLELGGSIGKFFYSIQRYDVCPPNLKWTIAELPEAVNLGIEIARERGERRLTFLDSAKIASAESADIFLTAGTLQYMETPLWSTLSSLAKLPRHVLIHTLPVHPTASYWTLQRLALCEVPYHIYSQAELLAQMDGLGYRQVTEWCQPRMIEIPFHRDLVIKGYCGFTFTRSA
jgi:putative methyltransferase (TIGR04325 family)